MGDELTLGRASRPKPLAVFPRRRIRDTDGIPQSPVCIMDIELAKGVAGCSICNVAIPKGTSRLKFTVRLPVPVVNENGSQRTHESYYLHPGCLTDRIKPEVIRRGEDCYDCGAWPPSIEEAPGWHPHGNWCFTVSRFAPAPICSTCLQKPKWTVCDLCQIAYPPWMIRHVIDERTSEVPQPFAAEAVPGIHGAKVACEHCTGRWGVRTSEEARDDAAEYERLRQEIAEHGFFGAGEDP